MQQSWSLSLKSVSRARSGSKIRNAVKDQTASRSKAKRICLFGLLGMDNYGNDGSLEAMLLFLRETWPDVTLSCVCIGPPGLKLPPHTRGSDKVARPLRSHAAASR